MFQVRLEPAHREKLEAYRARQGLRSEAAAVRALIDNAARLDAYDITGRTVLRTGLSKSVEVERTVLAPK